MFDQSNKKVIWSVALTRRPTKLLTTSLACCLCSLEVTESSSTSLESQVVPNVCGNLQTTGKNNLQYLMKGFKFVAEHLISKNLQFFMKKNTTCRFEKDKKTKSNHNFFGEKFISTACPSELRASASAVPRSMGSTAFFGRGTTLGSGSGQSSMDQTWTEMWPFVKEKTCAVPEKFGNIFGTFVAKRMWFPS